MFFGHCQRTRFRDSFCLASVFEMTVYLLTYQRECASRIYWQCGIGLIHSYPVVTQ